VRVTRAIRLHKWRTTAVVVVLAAGAGLGIWLTTGSAGADYELTSAATGTVQQSVSATSTIEAVNQADVDFATAGKVATVSVVVGQQVAAGAVLGTLDPSTLQATVAQDEASVAGDESKLDSDESGQTVQTANQAITTAQQQVTLQNQQIATDQTAITNDQTNLTATEASNAVSLAQSQNAVTDAQTKLSTDETTLSTDETTESTEQTFIDDNCPSSTMPVTYGCTSMDTSTLSADEAKVTADETTITQDQQSIQVDQLSLQSTQIKNAQAVTSAQQAITNAQQTLANAQVTLQDDEQTVTNDQNNVNDDQGSLGSQIQSDEASLEAANVQLQSAESDLSSASLTAPVGGTVTEVNVSVGDEATAGTTVVGSSASSSSSSSSSSGSTPTYAFEIIGTAAFDADASISSADVAQVQVGDQAQLTVSGSATPVYGTVSSLGLVATVSSGVATFPVTISVTGTPSGLYSGMTATTSIIVLDRSNVLTVPSSAVHTLGTSSFVYELSKGKEVEHTVTVGAVGTTLTQITAGLASGDKVVLANLAAVIPTAGTSTSPFGGGLGGLGGGGAFRITGGGGLGGGGFVGRGLGG
jgi:macrolide-specific efflux system membrane fusion protein